MKARMHFDTLTYANKLKAAGMDPKLAEVQALALVDAMEDGIATKTDLSEVKAELAQLRSELKAEITQLQSESKTAIAHLKSELIQWMVGLFIINISITGAFIAISQYLSHTH